MTLRFLFCWRIDSVHIFLHFFLLVRLRFLLLFASIFWLFWLRFLLDLVVLVNHWILGLFQIFFNLLLRGLVASVLLSLAFRWGCFGLDCWLLDFLRTLYFFNCLLVILMQYFFFFFWILYLLFFNLRGLFSPVTSLQSFGRR